MKKILVVEDEFDVRTSIRDLLEEKGYRVFSAPDGKEGIGLALELVPDLIICDIMMPGMDGFEVIKAVSENESTRAIPFIFLTARAEMGDLRQGMQRGADDYLIKPFKAADLLNAIETRLAKFEAIRSQSPGQVSEDEKQHQKKVFSENDRMFIVSENRAQFVRVGDIMSIVSENQYTRILLNDGRKLLVRKLLKDWEGLLPASVFLRIHRSCIINLSGVEKIQKWYKRSYAVCLKGVTEPYVISERYASRIKSYLLR